MGVRHPLAPLVAKTTRSAAIPVAIVPIWPPKPIAAAALLVAMATRDASSNARPKYLVLRESAQASSFSMFIDPVGGQSVAREIGTPATFISVMGSVSPYRLTLDRGAQTTLALAA